MMQTSSSALVSVAVITAVALTACANTEEGNGATDEQNEQTQDVNGQEQAETAEEEPTNDDEVDEEEDQGQVEPSARETHEAGGPSPRLVVTHETGVAVIDGATLEVLNDFDTNGFTRVNPAGDGRHAFLTEGESFRLLDTGTWGEPHGDHNHYYTTEPLLTDITVDGETPGHVVSHHGVETLFFDGTGEIHWFDLEDLDPENEISTETAETEQAHHGVAVVMEDGSRFETLGDDETRTGARFLDPEGEEVARSEDCPGVHGEATGPEGIIAVGCEDGVLIWDGDAFEKVAADDEFARIGNLFPAEGSPVFLGDYRTDEDWEDPMTEVALIDAESLEINTTELGSAYNFRNLARGPEAEALVLTEDGQLHLLDEATGEHQESLQVIEEWTEPEDWQDPRPAIRVSSDIAYVTEPATQQIHMIDLNDLQIINSVEFDFIPNEIEATDGQPIEGVSDEYEDDQDHDHDHDEEHDHGDHDDDHDHDSHDHDDHDHDHHEDEHDHDHDDDHDH